MGEEPKLVELTYAGDTASDGTYGGHGSATVTVRNSAWVQSAIDRAVERMTGELMTRHQRFLYGRQWARFDPLTEHVLVRQEDGETFRVPMFEVAQAAREPTLRRGSRAYHLDDE
jgi:hypothetical protein